jgi:hypothetical protein
MSELSDERLAEIECSRGTDRDHEAVVAELLTARAKLAKYEEAVKPSGDTKAAYIGEFTFPLEQWDPNAGEDGEGELVLEDVTVPWTTVKEIMAAIKARALTQETSNEQG